MILKLTWLSIADNTNVKWLQVFHLYKGFHRKRTGLGFFIKGSARIVEPPRIEYKGFKFKFNKKGDICRAIIVRTKFPTKRLDGSVLYFRYNNALLIRKKQDLKSKYVFGPVSSTINRKKFKSIFKTVI
jgi:large subunit ribosomal protein L14